MHRSRWDGLIIGYALGRPAASRNLNFIVSADEMQGWLIRQMGGFPVDTTYAGLTAIRHGLYILKSGESLVIFPEGDIVRSPLVNHLKPGIARLALQAQRLMSRQTTDVQILPVAVQYDTLPLKWGANAWVNIGRPINVSQYLSTSKQESTTKLMIDLKASMNYLGENLPRDNNTSDINSAYS